MGKPERSMILMVFYYMIVRMPLAYILSKLGFGLTGIWLGILVSHTLASLMVLVSENKSFLFLQKQSI